jgi:hypothetical protein
MDGKYADFTHLMTRWPFPPAAEPIRAPCLHSSVGAAGLRKDQVNSVLTLAGKQIAKLRGTARIGPQPAVNLYDLWLLSRAQSWYWYKTAGVGDLTTSSLIAR